MKEIKTGVKRSKTAVRKTGAAAGKYKQDYAYDYLKQAIISGEFPPEKLLVEWEICEKLDISRTPVREALRRLSSEGLVDAHPGRGTFVTRVTAEDMRYIYELKEALERMAVRFCIQRMAGGELAEMKRCLTAHERAYVEQKFELAADMDLQFHVQLMEYARSPKIEEHAKMLLSQTRRLSQISVYDTSNIWKFIEEHRAIYEAIAAQDIPAAEAAVSRHIDSIIKFQGDKRSLFF